MKCRKLFKQTLCIFLSVVLIFFSVNNSYFSPHKMDNVEATAAVAAVAISADVIIELIAAIGVSCLGVAIINDIVDWDWNAICNDVHDWCRENLDILEQYVTDGTSALKEWALADEWEVVEGGGGTPEPSPDPDDDSSEKFSHKIWGASDVWNIGNLIAGAGVLSAEFYNKYVPEDEGIVEVAKAYVNDKIANYHIATPLEGIDPITDSLQSTYGVDDDKPHYYGDIEKNGSLVTISMYGSSGDFYLNFNDTFSGTLTLECDRVGVYEYQSSNNRYQQLFLYSLNGTIKIYTPQVTRYVYDKSGNLTNTQTANFDSAGVPCSVNIPKFNNSDELRNYLTTGDDSVCINKEREHNYIDSSDEYGWASTANLSPADLAQANPALADDLIGRDVSISSLVAAINALKKQLEDQNPNTSTGGASIDPVPYPDVPTYTLIVNEVVSDPDVFPETGSSTDTDPGTSTDPGTETDPDAEAGKDYTGLLGTIIGLLQQILQAIKDFMSWFVIDFPAIKAHLLVALDNVPGADGLDPFLAIVTDIKGQITDSYEYPKITIQTPDILVQFVKAPEIVLLDFKDYAEYFIWVRTAMAFAILFGFAMWCVRDIKVELTLN